MGCLTHIVRGFGAPFDRLWAVLAPSTDSTSTFLTDRPLETAIYQDPHDRESLFVVTSYESQSDNGYAQVEAETLTTTLRRAAAAALLGKHWPPSSDRQIGYIV